MLTLMTLDNALGLVQTGMIVLIAAAAVVGIVRWIRDFGPVPSWRRPKPDPNRELEVHLHDWSCNTGQWPHDGDCDPVDAAHAALIGQCVARGIGRLPAFPARGEDERCDGN